MKFSELPPGAVFVSSTGRHYLKIITVYGTGLNAINLSEFNAVIYDLNGVVKWVNPN